MYRKDNILTIPTIPARGRRRIAVDSRLRLAERSEAALWSCLHVPQVRALRHPVPGLLKRVAAMGCKALAGFDSDSHVRHSELIRVGRVLLERPGS